MKQILVVNVSPRGTESASRKITERLTIRLHAQHPGAKIVHRDTRMRELERKRPLNPILKVLAEKWEGCGRGSRG